MRIILLTYINRSGSTFLSSELGKSASVLACPEADCLLNIFLSNPTSRIQPTSKNKIIHLLQDDPKFKSWELKDILYTIDFNQTGFLVFYQILEAYRLKTKPSAEKVIYKAEGLFHLLSDRHKSCILWENCDIISLVRDIRSIYNSQRYTRIPESNKIMSRNIFKTCLYWNSYIRKMIIDNPTHKMVIQYETLVSSYPETLLQIAKLLNIKEPSYTLNTDLFDRLPSNHRKIHKNIMLPPLKSRISAWKEELPINIVQHIEFISGEYLRDLGYLTENKRHSPFLLIILSVHYLKYLVFRIFKTIFNPYRK